MINRLLPYLQQPVPELQDWRAYTRLVLLVSLFVSCFLYFFTPFNIVNVKQNLLLVCIGFGVVNFLVCMSYQWLLRQVIYHQGEINWTFWKWLLSTLLMVVIIGIANTVYILVLENHAFSFDHLLWTIISAVMLGLIPIIFIGTLKVNKATQKYTDLSSQLSPSTDEQADSYDNVSVQHTILCYVESKQNYVYQTFIKGGEINTEKSRTTLSIIEEEITNDRIIRCHRSYIVNLDQVIRVSGNAQGLKLHFRNIEEYVPVSRKYIQVVKQKMA